MASVANAIAQEAAASGANASLLGNTTPRIQCFVDAFEGK